MSVLCIELTFTVLSIYVLCTELTLEVKCVSVYLCRGLNMQLCSIYINPLYGNHCGYAHSV